MITGCGTPSWVWPPRIASMPRDARGHLEVDVHAVVREHDNDLGALGAGFVDRLLHVVVLDAEGPVRHHPARVGDRRVGEGLADHGDLDAVHFAQAVGFEHLVAEVRGLDVLGEKFDLALKVLFDDFQHALVAEGELPVRGHHVHAQQLAGIDHVLALGPQGGGRTLPGVAAVEQQRVGASRAQALDQGRQVGEAADLAVGLAAFSKFR
jgi:hypothetical protein